jgi:hypothetical protein
MTNGLNRPKSVTVIGVVWIVLGCLMFLGAVGGLLVQIIMVLTGGMAGATGVVRIFVISHRVLCIVQVGVSVVAVIAGIHLLRLKSWARNVLEALTWWVLIFIVCFCIGTIIILCVLSAQSHAPGLIVFAVLIIPAMLPVGIPGVILLKQLRSATIKNAMITKPTEVRPH